MLAQVRLRVNPGRMSPGTERRVEDGMTVRLQGNPEAAAHARHALGRLRSDIDSPLMETLRLLVTELVSNSVIHAGADRVVLKVLVGRKARPHRSDRRGPGLRSRRTGAARPRIAPAGGCSWWSGSPTAGA